MTASRILLADDHVLFREGLAGLIRSQSDLQVVGQAGEGLEALSLARDLRPDLIVMDIKMPICDGLEATRLIRSALPDIRILILTVHDEDEKLFEAVKSGAHGYLLKSVTSGEFLNGVRGALAGEAVLPPRLASSLLQEFARISGQAIAGTTAPWADLTPREAEVLKLLATGATDKQIATRLSLSPYTVKSHVRSILNKLHAVNRRDAVRLTARPAT